MLFRLTPLLLAFVTISFADVLTLRSGATVQGEYLGGDARHIRMAVGDRVETYAVDEVSTLRFGGGQRTSAYGNDRPGFSTPSPALRSSGPDYGIEIPAGTTLVVRMIDAVDSERARLGETFRASVDEPLAMNGQTVISRGADAVVKLVEDKQSGKFEGRTVLTLDLMQVLANGRMVDINTADVSQSSGSRGARTAKVVGGTTALGAIIGAIAGGGKGAAIGAASGAAVGGGVEVMTKGQRVRIPSETRLTFTLQQPLRI